MKAADVSIDMKAAFFDADVVREKDCIQLYIFLEKHLHNRKSWCIISKKHGDDTFFWNLFPGDKVSRALFFRGRKESF